MKAVTRNLSGLLFALLVLGLIFSSASLNPNTTQEIPISSLVEKIKSAEVKSLVVKENLVTGLDETDKPIFESRKEKTESLTDLLQNYGLEKSALAALKIEISEPSAASYWVKGLLPTIIIVIGFSIVLWFFLRQMQGANNRALTFGQANAKDAKDSATKLTFADIAGNPEAKEELSEIVEFLKTPKKFIDVGAKIPKGVLLMGPPGTGKTLMARAVAGEAEVPFFHISGSEFVEMFVGVGASRVRDLFAKAKKQAPAIIFIDEIDAVGRQRGAGLGGGHDEREQTLNQILVEMDGFDPNLGVIVIAATNRPDVLDPALLRPGRFDRRVTLDRPDLKARQAILAIHSAGKPLDPDVDLKTIAERTVGMSGADLMNVFNEAAILTARQNRTAVTQVDLLSAIEKVMLGPERKSHILSDAEKTLTAYHEAGHALVGHFLPHCDTVHKISLISRGRAAGYTMSIPDEDKKMHTKEEFEDELAMMLGGYAAEKTIFGVLTTGASNDLQRATAVARDLVTQYGMSAELGPRTYGEREDIFLGRQIRDNRNYSEKFAERIDEEINKFLSIALNTAIETIKTHRTKMDLVVKRLLEKEMIEKAEFEELVGPAVKAPVPTPLAA